MFKRVLHITVIAFGMLLLVGCTAEEYSSIEEASEESGTVFRSYITLSFSTAKKVTTRSFDTSPAGGEWGDGREIGQDYENEVTSAALFLYQDEDGVNGDASTPVSMVYFGEVIGEKSGVDDIDYIATTYPVGVDLEEGTYNVLAIANPHDLSWAYATNLTLGDVRDHIEKEAWTETTTISGTKSYSSFLMTSESGGETITLAGNPKEDPATTTIAVERMAARVDYYSEGDMFAINATNTATKVGEVKLLGGIIVNNLTAGSYFSKRVNEGWGEPVIYLGEEENSVYGTETNYVVDPWTVYKGLYDSFPIDGKAGTVSDLYGIYFPGEPTDDEEQDPAYWEALCTAGTEVTDEEDITWNCIGYTMENCAYRASYDYCTAAVLSAEYIPEEGQVASNFYENYTYTSGSTFFKWDGYLFATPEDMMLVEYYVSRDSDGTYISLFTTDKFADSIDACQTWGDVADFASTLSNSDPTGYKAYLQAQVETNDEDGLLDDDEYRSTLYWVNYMKSECGYAFDEAECELILNDFPEEAAYTSTRAALYAYTNKKVNTYESAMCYYDWWLQHSYNDTASGTMGNCVVRNNIYKLRVSAIDHIGNDVPLHGLTVSIGVNPWVRFPEEEVPL